MADRRRKINAFVEERKESFSGAVDMYSDDRTSSSIDNGLGEATDVLLIDETLVRGLRQLREGLRRQP